MSIKGRYLSTPEKPFLPPKILIDLLNTINQYPNQPESAILQLIELASTDDIDDFMQAQTNDQYSTLHIVIMLEIPNVFIALIEKASQPGLDAALRLQNKFQSTVLDTALAFLPHVALKILMSKASNESINENLLIRNMRQCTALHTALQRQSEQGIITLLEKASSESISAALFVASSDGEYPLHIAAQRVSERAFIALVTKSSPAALDLAISLRSRDQWTGLKTATRYQYDQSMIALIENTSRESINETIYAELKEEWTSLHSAAYSQSNEVFIALVNKTSRDALNAALLIRNVYGHSTLAMMLKMRPEKAIAFLKRSETSEEEVNKRIHCVMNGNISYSALEQAPWPPQKMPSERIDHSHEEIDSSEKRVIAIKSEIYGKNDWRLSIFGSRYKLQGKEITQTAARILDIIDAAEKSKISNRWDIALNQVQDCLEHRPKMGALNRYQDSDSFYDGLAARCFKRP